MKKLQELLGPQLSSLMEGDIYLGFNIDDLDNQWRGPVVRAALWLEKLKTPQYEAFLTPAAFKCVDTALRALRANMKDYEAHKHQNETRAAQLRALQFQEIKNQLRVGDLIELCQLSDKAIPSILQGAWKTTRLEEPKERVFEVTAFDEAAGGVRIKPGLQYIRGGRDGWVQRNYKKEYVVRPGSVYCVLRWETKEDQVHAKKVLIKVSEKL